MPFVDYRVGMDSMRTMLRDHSRSAHQHLDAMFEGGIGSVRAYRFYLLGMERLLRVCDAGLVSVALPSGWADWRQRLADRMRFLAADLASLRLLPSGPARPLDICGTGQAIGVLYVLEGSVLGARRLARDVAGLGFDGANGAAFLHHHAGDAGSWPRFVEQLDALPVALAPALQAGALSAFAVAVEAFGGNPGEMDA